MAASVKSVDMVSRTSPRKKKKQRGRPPRPSSQPDDVSITQFQQRLEKLDTVVGPRPTSAARASSDSLAAEAAKLEEKAASKMLAERQAQVEEELSQDEAEFERIRSEREELERQLAEMEAVDEPPPPAKTPPRPQRRRRRRKPPKEVVAPIQSPPPEEPTAILYGDMRDVGGRVEVFSFRFNRAYAGDVVSYDPKRGLHCVAYDDGEKKWHDLFDKSIKCLKAGNGRETPDAAPPSTTPPALARAGQGAAGRAVRPRRKKKLTNNPVAATATPTTSPCNLGNEIADLGNLGGMYGPGRADAAMAFWRRVFCYTARVGAGGAAVIGAIGGSDRGPRSGWPLPAHPPVLQPASPLQLAPRLARDNRRRTFPNGASGTSRQTPRAAPPTSGRRARPAMTDRCPAGRRTWTGT